MSNPPTLPPFPPVIINGNNPNFSNKPSSGAPSLPKMPENAKNPIKTENQKQNNNNKNINNELDESSDEDEPPPIPEFPQSHPNSTSHALHQSADLSDSDSEAENDEKNPISPPPLPKMIPIQIVVETAASAPVASKYDSKQIYNVAKEFVDTEARFVQTMKILCDLIISPCQAAVVTGKATMGSIAVDSRVQVFFSMAVQIYTLNGQFLQELTKIVDNWTETSNIGLTFIHYAPLFKIFGQYVRDHELISAILLTAAARNGSKFSEFIKQAEADPRAEKQKLSSLLIQPVQRVPRYVLLLQELRRRTPPEHPAYSDLLAACDQANEAAKHVNEAIRQRENREKLVDFEKKFVDKIDLRDTDIPRFLIREGELKRLTRKGATHYYFHLFNDLLMYSEDTVKGYKLHRRVDLGDRCSVEDKSTGDEHSILISSPQKSFVICAKDAVEKLAWFNDLKNCIQKIKEETSGNNKNSFVAPVWEQDKVANKCTLCETKFTMIKRRHHCRQCGRLVCGNCSNHKLLIKQIDQKNEVRVCDTCFGSQGGAVSITSTTSKTENSISGTSSTHRKSGSLDLGQVSNETDSSTTLSSPTNQNPSIPRFSNASLNSPPVASSSRISIVSDNSTSGDEKIESKIDNQVEENFAIRTKLEKQKPKFLSDPRYSIACDLYLSESIYCTDLKNLIEVFVKPFLRLITDQNKGKSKTLAASSATLNGKKIPPNVLVFLNNIEPIYTLNLELLRNLEKRAVEYNSTETCFGNLFLRYASLFQLYRQYSVNHFQAFEVLQQDPEFSPIMKKFEEECKKLTMMQTQKETKYVQLFINRIEEGDEDEEDQPSAEQKMNQNDTRTNSTSTNAIRTPNIYQTSELLYTLEDLLRSPILRCSKYSWFLTQLNKQTKETHKDYNDLILAGKAIQSALEAIQQSVIEGDNMAKLVELEKKFVGGGSKVKLLEPRRALIKEGMLRRITRRGATNYYFHLFNDLLLYSEETVKGYKLHRWMPLNEVVVQDKLNDDTQPHAIQILSPQKSFVVCARDSGEKKRWLDSLNRAVNAVTNASAATDSNNNNTNTAATTTTTNNNLSPTPASTNSDIPASPQSPQLNNSTSSSNTEPVNNSNSPPPLTRPASTAAPVWTQDSAVSVCTYCNKTKFGLITRRHHCRKCGKVVCDGCSKNKMLLSHIHKTELQRVCDGCWTAAGYAVKTSPKTSPKSAARTLGTSPTLSSTSSPNQNQFPTANLTSPEPNNNTNNINNNNLAAIANLPVVGSLDKPNFFIE